jgi:hypothetical protein
VISNISFGKENLLPTVGKQKCKFMESMLKGEE